MDASLETEFVGLVNAPLQQQLSSSSSSVSWVRDDLTKLCAVGYREDDDDCVEDLPICGLFILWTALFS